MVPFGFSDVAAKKQPFIYDLESYGHTEMT